MRILIIEDHPAIGKGLVRELKSFYAVDLLRTGKDGLRHALATAYDVILLDLNLPDLDGEEVCRKIRSKGKDTPIIVISGRDHITDKVNLLDMGADDYITKPFNLEEVRSRINAAIRRNSRSEVTGLLTVEDVVLNPIERTVHRSGVPIQLRRKEFDLLEYLMRYRGQALSRVMILEHVWDMNENLWANVVDVHIKYLRDKIDRPFGGSSIQTVHGIGYKIDISKKKGGG